ncbi:unnamed protein product [Spirodela intermedia]|uniref:CID domain-containing protein n=1 Tax=Spirodela intermedia TaxID=51605 RepID=A0A7I8JDV7_SPIIN|nr:unnamed protein product [Spirodela intermedia]CAA6668340.1 unnamed protein product [Spirodela intermedia]
MNGTFNGQILVDKLSKLNSSQQSIETLSHWCIFHRKNAKQVVETWDRQFHCAPKSQWVSFLYLANDILQNSRRKGLEFVNEFWKVLPDALNNVMENGDEFGRSAAVRLVDIWEGRNRGQTLKDEIFGRKLNTDVNRNIKGPNSKLNQSVGDVLEKLISNYKRVYEGPVDELILLDRCQNAISSIEKVEKDMDGNLMLGDVNGSQVVEELEGQHMILRECVEQLKMAESSRVSLVSNLREALHEQELKLEQVRKHLQASQLRLEQAGSISQRLGTLNNGQSPNEIRVFSEPPPTFIEEAQSPPTGKEQPATVNYIQQEPALGGTADSEEHRKTAAAAVAAKLTASSSSAEMLSYVLSSLASEGTIHPQGKEQEEASSDGKRPKLESSTPPYIPQQASQLATPYPLNPSQPQLQHGSLPGLPLQPPLQPPLPPMPPPAQYMQVGSMAGVPYGYGAVPLQRPPPLPNFPMGSNMSPYMGQPSPYQGFQASEGGFFTQQPPLPAAPPPQSASRQ